MADLEHENLVFIDESGVNMKLCRRYARAIGGARVKAPIPFIRGKNNSMIGAVTSDEVLAFAYGEWATNTASFLKFLEKFLCPKLNTKHTVILDNVKFHQSLEVREAIESTGAKILFLPPYSPDYSPIENMWSKMKTYLRSAVTNTSEKLKKAINASIKTINSSDLAGWFKHCGYVLDL